jgi:phospholipid/cholesterol/gamma-HCH transport system substrate-binding protein
MRRGLLVPLVKLVVFVLVTVFATYVLAQTISNASFGSTYTYKGLFTDVSGLQNGDDVRIAGVRVGSVTGITVISAPPGTAEAANNGHIAQVTFSVQKSHRLPTSTRLFLRYRNLVGQRYIDVEQGTGDPNQLLPTHHAPPIPVLQTQNALDLTSLFNGFKPLFEQALTPDQINNLSGEIIGALQGEGGALPLLLSNLADLTNAIANKDVAVGQVVDNLSSVLTQVGSRDTELTNLIVQLQGFVTGLANDRGTIDTAITGINNLATTTTDLLSKARAPLAADISNLSALAAGLDTPASVQAINFVLQNMPNTVGALIRTASYGSWFNFYLCTVSGTITLPGGTNVRIPVTHSPAERCK